MLRYQAVYLALPAAFLACNTAKTFSGKFSFEINHFHEPAEGSTVPPELPNSGKFSPMDALWVTKIEPQMQ